MRRTGLLLLAPGLLAPTLAAQGPLAVGTTLVYASGGQEAPPWVVEAATHGLALGGMSGCSRIRWAAGGPRATADERTTCRDARFWYGWDSTASRWRALRPLAAGDTLTLRAASGTTSHYRADSTGTETIGAVALEVVFTTIVTRDGTGRPLRRLVERFAPHVGSATWGAFQAADSTIAGGWRTEREFRLVALRPPGR